jgi:hypothetical protein
MRTDLAPSRTAPAEAVGERPASPWALLALVPLIVAFFGVQMRAVAPDGVVADLDIQLTLSRLTLDGAIPLIDFEHGWNTASWYFGALLHDLAGGNATVWTFLWGRVTGFMLAGVAVLVLAHRLRLDGRWASALVLAWLLVTHIPNAKYAVPLLWGLLLLPVGRTARPGVAQALRIGMVATVWWFHIELAVLLGVGTAMHDLLGAPERPLVERAKLVGAVVAGGLIGVGSQVAVYAVLGLGPAELLRQLLFGQAETSAANFGYPLGAPGSLRQLVFPASVVVPFVPAICRRLSEPTRLLAFLHLAMSLIGIRRTDFNHVAAAATLLAPLVILGVRDLVRTGGAESAGTLDRWRAIAWPRRLLGLGMGAGWAALAIAAGFRIESRLAIVALTLVCLLGVAAAYRAELPWASLGALAALGALMAGGLAGHLVLQARSDQGGEAGVQLAEDIRADVADCLDGPAAWVVPGPGSLYDDLDLANPTPHYVFWYTLEGESDRVIADLADVPAILQVGGWPESMVRIAPVIERDYDVCAQVDASTGQRVTIWVR